MGNQINKTNNNQQPTMKSYFLIAAAIATLAQAGGHGNASDRNNFAQTAPTEYDLEIDAVYDKLNTEGLTMYYNATTELLIDTQAGSTGYEWIQSNDCKDILNVSHAIEQDEDNEQMMGAPELEVFTLKPKKTGSCTFRLQEA